MLPSNIKFKIAIEMSLSICNNILKIHWNDMSLWPIKPDIKNIHWVFIGICIYIIIDIIQYILTLMFLINNIIPKIEWQNVRNP